MQPLNRALLIGALALAPGVQAGQISLLREAPAGTLQLVQVDEATLATTILADDIEVLPVTLAGFSRVDGLRGDVPRPVTDAAPAPGIRLPGAGTLYRVAQGDSVSLLRVDALGSSLLATAADAVEPALQDAVAVRADGLAALLATSTGAGGLLRHVDLLDGSLVDMRLPGGAAVDASSLRLGPLDAWCLADGLLHHADPTTGAVLTFDLGLAPGEVLHPGLELSRDGSHAAVVSERLDGARHLYVVSSTGTVTRMTSEPLPGEPVTQVDVPSGDDPLGPAVALNDDGSCIAWRQTFVVPQDSTELFVREVTGPPPTQVTQDAQFTDTIDNVGVLGYAPDGRLVFVAGELPLLEPDIALGSADVFLVDPLAPQSIVNVTQTSGEALPPFLTTGELELRNSLRMPDGTGVLLEVDPQDGDFALHHIDLVSGTASVAAGPFDDPPQLHPAGDHVVVDALHTPDLPGAEPVLQIVDIAPGGAGSLLVETSALVAVDRWVESRGGRTALVAGLTPDLELPVVIDPAFGLVLPMMTGLLSVAPGLAFAPGGDLVAGLGIAGGPWLFAALDGPASGVVLPVGVKWGLPLQP